MAFNVAFSQGGGATSAVDDWWNRLNDYLFGYTQTHPLKIGGKVIAFTTTQVAGIFAPLREHGRQP